MAYLYNDEDNNPMDEQNFPVPFDDPKHDNGCWNCMNYDWTREACTTNWNNMDESYYNPDIDDRKPDDSCADWEINPDAEWEDWHDGTDTRR